MQKITPHLWFDKNAEEAMSFYVSVFKEAPSQEAKNSEIIKIHRYPSGYSEGPLAGMEGKVLNGQFKLAGQELMALDGGPVFKFNESISMVVQCQDQEEIDYFWEKLSAVPEAEQCGWCKDKYGLSWQIIPKIINELISSPASMDAMMKMKKIDINKLKEAAK